MNTEKMMISIPFNEWQEINDKIDSYDKLQEKYENSLEELKLERIKKRFFYRVGTDANYKVSVKTINLFDETFEESEKFEKMIRESVEREMEIRKEYDTKIKNLWNCINRIPLWVLKLFGYREKAQK